MGNSDCGGARARIIQKDGFKAKFEFEVSNTGSDDTDLEVFDFGKIFGPGPVVEPDLYCYIKGVKLTNVNDPTAPQDQVIFPSNDVVAGNCYSRPDPISRIRNPNCFEGIISKKKTGTTKYKLEYVFDDDKIASSPEFEIAILEPVCTRYLKNVTQKITTAITYEEKAGG